MDHILITESFRESKEHASILLDNDLATVKTMDATQRAAFETLCTDLEHALRHLRSRIASVARQEFDKTLTTIIPGRPVGAGSCQKIRIGCEEGTLTEINLKFPCGEMMLPIEFVHLEVGGSRIMTWHQFDLHVGAPLDLPELPFYLAHNISEMYMVFEWCGERKATFLQMLELRKRYQLNENVDFTFPDIIVSWRTRGPDDPLENTSVDVWPRIHLYPDAVPFYTSTKWGGVQVSDDVYKVRNTLVFNVVEGICRPMYTHH